MKAALFNVDVDSLWVYAQEFGVNSKTLPDLAYQEALPRLLEIIKGKNIKVTFFVTGKDLKELPAARNFCRQAAAQGHEIANHSFSHCGRFEALSVKELENEVIRTHNVITEACDTVPVGFRSPDYNINNKIFQVLIRHGYRYDTSVFPGWSTVLMRLYYLNFKFKNKKFGNFNYLLSSSMPRRLKRSKDWQKSFWELPITAAPLLRVPFHPSVIYQFGWRYLNFCLNVLKIFTPNYCIFLMHAVDLADFTNLKNKKPFPDMIFTKWQLKDKIKLINRYIDFCIESNMSFLTNINYIEMLHPSGPNAGISLQTAPVR
ncbi:MAG: polysaccharide deacetylase family protein [Desulfarculales bacterium]|jgi:peptidoglycan/xylan/chitin deacetylase (PgdA/CDA1 family)|nr:polysaccharide deacetylase family protein [Desulfarculales bacterium]